MSEWQCLYRDLTYVEARRRARKELDEDKKLRELGGRGNYYDVRIVLASHLLNRKRYNVYVYPIPNDDDSERVNND